RVVSECSSRYWITSSAVANSVSGMVRPSALAVLRFMTNSNLVGCCTGRSLHRLVDDALRNGRVHRSSVGPPDQDRVVVLRQVPTVGVPQRAAPRVGRGGAEQHRAWDGRHAGAQRVEYLVVRVGGVLGRPEGQLVAQRRHYRVAAHASVRGG